ncbi:HYC_CC_PP family protein [Fibrella aquatica]|uniref:HYC_CC_PP family protein n=1 Tax=Fibrella aquatica TaxID=3242487 RepID=UPI003521FE5B
MKAALIRFLHLFMAVVVLLSSMGFGLVEHSCQLRGKRIVSVHEEMPTCKFCQVRTQPAEQAPTIGRTDCCKDDTRYTKVDITSSMNHKLASFIKALGDQFGTGITTVFLTLFGWVFTLQANVPAPAYASPPPLSGRTLLVFVQTFLI